MSNNELSQLLKILLLVSIVIFFVLLVLLIVILVKRKLNENKEKDEEQLVKEAPKKENIVQTKLYSPHDIKNFLEFDEIKDNMIIQDKGKRLVMVVQCQGINYDLMSSMEKISVERGFVQFLNSLTRPIQLYVQSRKVNLEESVQNYKRKLKEIEQKYNRARLQYEQAQTNVNISAEKFDMIRLEYIRLKNLYEYTKDIIGNTEKMSLNKNILTKNYYIAISYVPDNTDNLFEKEELFDMAFSELYTTSQSLLRVLAVCGVTGRILDSVELADLLYVAYNRDASEIYGVDKAIQAGYDSLYTTAPDIIDKKIQALDKMIEERALSLANKTIEETVLNGKRKKELEEKEKHIQESIRNLAIAMIEENEAYVGKQITEEAVQKIEEQDKKAKEKKAKTRKGA